MTVCSVWLARDFLRRTGRPVDIPPCPHSNADCPEPTGVRAADTPHTKEKIRA